MGFAGSNGCCHNGSLAIRQNVSSHCACASVAFVPSCRISSKWHEALVVTSNNIMGGRHRDCVVGHVAAIEQRKGRQGYAVRRHGGSFCTQKQPRTAALKAASRTSDLWRFSAMEQNQMSSWLSSLSSFKVALLQIGEEYKVGGFLVKPFQTYHTVPSQVGCNQSIYS